MLLEEESRQIDEMIERKNQLSLYKENFVAGQLERIG